MDALYQQEPAETQGSEAALGGPLGAVQPCDEFPALPLLPALHGLSIIIVIVLWNTQAVTHLQTPVWSFSCCQKTARLSCPSKFQPQPWHPLVYNPVLYAVSDKMDSSICPPKVTSLLLRAISSPQPYHDFCLAPHGSGSRNAFLIESPPINPGGREDERDNLTLFFEEKFLVKFN